MSLFLATFLFTYGSMHLYVFWHLTRAFTISRTSTRLLIAALAFAAISPLLVRLSESSCPGGLTEVLAWAGYCWMGFIFILVSVFFILDLLRIIVFLLFTARTTRAARWFFCSRILCSVAITCALSASVYGFYEALSFRTETITVPAPFLPAKAKPVRIVQLSDVHLGLIVREKRLARIASIVNQAKPDILVSTGDLVDGRLSRRDERSAYEGVTNMLAAIRAPLGKFAVPGNHEYYAGLEQSLAVTRAAGFRVLRNEAVDLRNGLSICGSDDPAWKQTGQPPPPGPHEVALLASQPQTNFRVYLKHRPNVAAGTEHLFNLQLSGHTHRGQIFPFYLITKLEYPLPSGTTRLEHGAMIHISRGTGTWGPPIRFLAPPEITIIDVIPAATKSQ